MRYYGGGCNSRCGQSMIVVGSQDVANLRLWASMHFSVGSKKIGEVIKWVRVPQDKYFIDGQKLQWQWEASQHTNWFVEHEFLRFPFGRRVLVFDLRVTCATFCFKSLRAATFPFHGFHFHFFFFQIHFFQSDATSMNNAQPYCSHCARIEGDTFD